MESNQKMMCMQRYDRMKRVTSLGLLFGVLLWMTGCTSTRGSLYLRNESVHDYLKKKLEVSKKCKEAKDDSMKKEHCQLVDSAVEEAREMLKSVPDASRRLGGFCTKPEILSQLRMIQDEAPTCRKKLKSYQNTSNTNGIVYWSILGGTALTGAAMVIGGVLAPDDGTRAGVVLGFGIPMTLAALTNAIAPFGRNYTVNQYKAYRIDNYLWSLRVRISIEVCNAADLDAAVRHVQEIVKDTKAYCAGRDDDGLFRPDKS